MKLKELVRFLDEYLKIKEIEDNSLNGMQIEGKSDVQTVALATDACSETFIKAASLRADMLIVHHGIFWGKQYPITGIHAERFRTLLTNGITLYAAHLPLDLHPEVGNNVELVRLTGFTPTEPFGKYHGVVIGYKGISKKAVRYETIINTIRRKLNTETIGYTFGKDRITSLAVVSGDGASMLEQVTDTDIDLFITGENDHISYHIARELKVNIIYAGHYATETLGVKSLSRVLKKEHSLNTLFIDVPTGM
jgi:dinuclear metal center YbgI/SA1388 family protein